MHRALPLRPQMWAVVPGPPWTPAPGVLVKDTAGGRLGKAVAWDGNTRMVTLAPPDGDGEQWETVAFRPADEAGRPSRPGVRGKPPSGYTPREVETAGRASKTMYPTTKEHPR